jgi:hypothetical protein
LSVCDVLGEPSLFFISSAFPESYSQFLSGWISEDAEIINDGKNFLNDKLTSFFAYQMDG